MEHVFRGVFPELHGFVLVDAERPGDAVPLMVEYAEHHTVRVSLTPPPSGLGAHARSGYVVAVTSGRLGLTTVGDLASWDPASPRHRWIDVEPATYAVTARASATAGGEDDSVLDLWLVAEPGATPSADPEHRLEPGPWWEATFAVNDAGAGVDAASLPPLPRALVELAAGGVEQSRPWAGDGELELGWLHSDSTAIAEDYEISDYLPGAVPIAFDGRGGLVLLDTRAAPEDPERWPVVWAHAGSLGWGPGDHRVLAPDFATFARVV